MNKKQKELIRIYIFLSIVIYIVINWDSASWIFNYREVSGLMYGFFNPYQESSLLVSANSTANTATPINNSLQKDAYPYSEKNNSLEIPSLGIAAPLVIGESTNIKKLEKDLDGGVVYYPGSVLPSENGQIIILGHSAPPHWPHIKYDWVFSDINSLNFGDEITLYFNNTKYTYQVIAKNIIKPGQEIGVDALSGKSNVLTIVSCWPPGKDYQRITVEAQLRKN